MAIVATTGERIKEAMAERGYKHQADVVRHAERFFSKHGRILTKNALSQYYNDKVEPKRDMIALIAEALDVNDAWLLGYDVPMGREIPVPIDEDGLNEELIKLLVNLTPEEVAKAIAFVQGLLAARKE